MSKKVSYYQKPSEMDYKEWQIALRRQFVDKMNYSVLNTGDHAIFSDFNVQNNDTNKSYRVAIRSEDIGTNFCTCLDFKTNALGTCKHIEFTLHTLSQKKSNRLLFKKPYSPPYSSVYLKYSKSREVCIRLKHDSTLQEKAAVYFDHNNCLKPDMHSGFSEFLAHAYSAEEGFRCYPDALSYISEINDTQFRKETLKKHYSGDNISNLDTLLKTSLYPYQKDAILFAASAGRALIADDMGLGKTVQAIGLISIMNKHFGVEKVLIVCPTSLKYQWKTEIETFSNHSICVIEGPHYKRKQQYSNDKSLIKIASYHSIHYDLMAISELGIDLIILDESQKIKNWDTRTSQTIKALDSPYALALTGTPLENKLQELYSIISFINPYQLGPFYEFMRTHELKNEQEKVIGYRNLNQIKEKLSDTMVRRTKAEVLPQLPKRIDKTIYVDITEEQLSIHNDLYESVCRLVNKWNRNKYLSEKDRHQLLKNLNCMRMVCNSTYILDQETRHDTKIDALFSFIEEPLSKGEKIVIFSQWERMTRLIAKELSQLSIEFEYLHGGIPSKDRRKLLDNFRDNPNSKIFLSTDAGGTGLNLQSANVIINMDCPWNPAVLEQRIGRVHRLGQEKSVYIINFITKGSFEERLVETVKFKQSVFSGVFDNGKDDVFVSPNKFKDFMKTVTSATESTVSPHLAEKDPIDTSETAQADVTQDQKTAPDINDIFEIGTNFLQECLATSKKNNSPIIQTDKVSGQKSLNIPLPSDEVVEKATHALLSFLDQFKK